MLQLLSKLESDFLVIFFTWNESVRTLKKKNICTMFTALQNTSTRIIHYECFPSNFLAWPEVKYTHKTSVFRQTVQTTATIFSVKNSRCQTNRNCDFDIKAKLCKFLACRHDKHFRWWSHWRTHCVADKRHNARIAVIRQIKRFWNLLHHTFDKDRIRGFVFI